MLLPNLVGDKRLAPPCENTGARRGSRVARLLEEIGACPRALMED